MILTRKTLPILFALFGLGPAAVGLRAGDWPQWGGSDSRNMVSDQRGLPDLQPPPGDTSTRLSSDDSPYVKWKVRLGATTWGNPTATDGRVYVGTSGPSRKGGTVKCFDAETGTLLWQLISPPRKFPTPERPETYEKYSP